MLQTVLSSGKCWGVRSQEARGHRLVSHLLPPTLSAPRCRVRLQGPSLHTGLGWGPQPCGTTDLRQLSRWPAWPTIQLCLCSPRHPPSETEALWATYHATWVAIVGGVGTVGGHPHGTGGPAEGWGHVPKWKIHQHWQQHLLATLLTRQVHRQALPLIPRHHHARPVWTGDHGLRGGPISPPAPGLTTCWSPHSLGLPQHQRFSWDHPTH